MSDPILIRVAKAIYRADEAPKLVDYGSLSPDDKRRYEVMAAAALSVALRLDMSEEAEALLNLPVSS